MSVILTFRTEDAAKFLGKPYQISRRDIVAVKIANWIINTFSSPHYQAFLAGVFSYGLNAAARDQREGIPIPPPYNRLTEPGA